MKSTKMCPEGTKRVVIFPITKRKHMPQKCFQSSLIFTKSVYVYPENTMNLVLLWHILSKIYQWDDSIWDFTIKSMRWGVYKKNANFAVLVFQGSDLCGINEKTTQLYVRFYGWKQNAESLWLKWPHYLRLEGEVLKKKGGL